METHTTAGAQHDFLPGSEVIYAMHGKCVLLGTEKKVLGDRTVEFYKLEVKKPTLSRSNRHEPAIWVPIQSARQQGLRAPMNKEDAEAALKYISNKDCYLDPFQPWHGMQKQLEHMIYEEGGAGLAKVVSFLHVLRKVHPAPTPEINRFSETVTKLLVRELSEAFQQPHRVIEEMLSKGLRHKTIPH